MSVPTISWSDDYGYGGKVFTLRVPDAWIVRTRWPRLALTWWLWRLFLRGGVREVQR